ncbi:hypothetical protein, variant 1 [Aphanomyces invadans]|uniref:Uncharacterized protein n=1 Tax=Aphanomyces invadans TaxID=157072 RepID=A0A024TLS1_9STRA|nr:hypothetical protein, variant 1 [Aphanomyces invadans]ETV94909.1 hypothetical protein, variant 1 [Aphanomyces invadans]|eukprot:XP_008876502.1 hypothetical protein, variant 1 [Aphanomyces invadans]
MPSRRVAGGAVAGVLVVVYVGPFVYHAMVRACLFLACVAAIAALSNPTDASFADWLATAHTPNTSTAESKALLSWMRSAIASWTWTAEDAASWVRHNMVLFTLVHVSSMERYALGCFGVWIWCDSSYALSWFARQYGPTIVALTHGGSPSGLHVNASTMPATAPSDSSEHAAKAKALQAQGQHDAAADAYLEAAAGARNLYVSVNYRLDAARCLAKCIDNHTSIHRVESLFRGASEEYASKGAFDDAGQCLVELAGCYAGQVSRCITTHNVEVADVLLGRQSACYVEAARVFEAGDHAAAAASANLAAAAIYATQGMALCDTMNRWRIRWLQTASELYKAMGVRYRPSLISKQADMLSICCYVALDDLERARRAYCTYAETLTSFRAPDHLLHGIFEAYEKWSPDVLDTAIVSFEASDAAPMVSWQKQALREWRAKLETVDLT